jgi:phosphate transport system permease protein
LTEPGVHRGLGRARGRARRRLVADRLARLVVTAGGFGIIASILGILVFLVVEIWPLLRPVGVTSGSSIALGERSPEALLVNEYRTHAATLGRDGRVRVYALQSGELVTSRALAAPHEPGSSFVEPLPEEAADAPIAAAIAVPQDGTLVAAGHDGEVWIQTVRFRVEFEGQTRRVLPELEPPLRLELDEERRPLRSFAARSSPEQVVAAGLLADDRVAVVERRVRENLFTGERTEEFTRRILPGASGLQRLLLDGEGRHLYGATDRGRIILWRLGDSDPTPQEIEAAGAALTSLEFLIGERSLVAAAADGSLGVWSWVRPRRGEPELVRIRELPEVGSALLGVTASQRNRTVLAHDAEGLLHLYFSTTGQLLWTSELPIVGTTAVAFAPKGDAVYIAGGGRLTELLVDNPHPETTLASLFGRVWYEGAREPEYVWQSTGGTDDFEPKLSLIPLLIGTLKGTLFSLALAIPLGVLGAMYTSQFMHPSLQRIVKPIVEVMASLPSVVLGFLAGLWLAPRLEGAFPGLILSLIAFPLLALLAGALFEGVPRRIRGRLPEGTEVFWFTGVIGLGLWGCFALGGYVEGTVFGGSFSGWLLESTGTRYDQRNAVVIGIAMGFAVIPIVFAMAEDAFSNVPRSLSAASRALGATPWQTVVRVILPTASPGIFSAVMVGFGRAIGETMIVLMATGNTPILDWSPFNGFRTLSANVAVEIPEAPVGGTLYRTLFVAALLLFALTFVINTGAELIRHRLRRKFARL